MKITEIIVEVTGDPKFDAMMGKIIAGQEIPTPSAPKKIDLTPELLGKIKGQLDNFAGIVRQYWQWQDVYRSYNNKKDPSNQDLNHAKENYAAARLRYKKIFGNLQKQLKNMGYIFYDDFDRKPKDLVGYFSTPDVFIVLWSRARENYLQIHGDKISRDMVPDDIPPHLIYNMPENSDNSTLTIDQGDV